MGIYEKLTNIQTDIKAPKNLYNSFGKYHYRNAESICEAVKPYLKKEGCSLILEDDVSLIGDRYYIKARAILIDNETGEHVSAPGFARESVDKKGLDAAQLTGATSSYARKYALNGLFLLDDTKDADSDEFENESKAKSNKASKSAKVGKETEEEKKLNQQLIDSVDPVYLPSKDGKATKEQLAKIESEFKRTGVDREAVLGMFGVDSVEKMDSAQVVTMLNKFKATPDKAK